MHKVIAAILLIRPHHLHQGGLVGDQPEAQLVQGLHQLQLRDNTVLDISISCACQVTLAWKCSGFDSR